jgi:DNA-directed RNA polymerase sigma subunit (sigma70/sigma32)
MVGRGMQFLDLIPGGESWSHQAWKFDYTKGYKFSTYAPGGPSGHHPRHCGPARTIRIPVHMEETITRHAYHASASSGACPIPPEEIAEELTCPW